MRVLVWILLLTVLVSAGNPPQLQPDTHNLQQVVVLGHNITVRCPLLRPVDFIVWKHNTEELQLSLRYRPSHKGYLKIIRVSRSDAGRYTCQAVNGFGSVEANITLIVHDPNSEATELPQEHNFYPEADNIMDGKVKSDTSKPVLMKSSRFRNELIQKPTGSSVILKCLFDGSPKPKVYWLKDGQRLLQKDLDAKSFMNRWTINLANLKESDSGLYTCIGHNPYGTVNRNFTLEVVGRIASKPEIVGVQPVNVTVVAGNMASFQCRVKSAAPPDIKWLKQVKGEDNTQHLLFENNAYYKVLKSGETMEHQPGVYLNKLQLPNVLESDSSKYICIAANVRGYNASTYYLNVVPFNSAKMANSELRKTSSLPVTVIVISVVLVVAMVVLAVVLSRYRYTQVKKGQSLDEVQGEDPAGNDAPSWLQTDSVSQGEGSTSKSCSHYHQHHHHHHHYRYKK